MPSCARSWRSRTKSRQLSGRRPARPRSTSSRPPTAIEIVADLPGRHRATPLRVVVTQAARSSSPGASRRRRCEHRERDVPSRRAHASAASRCVSGSAAVDAGRARRHCRRASCACASRASRNAAARHHHRGGDGLSAHDADPVHRRHLRQARARDRAARDPGARRAARHRPRHRQRRELGRRLRRHRRHRRDDPRLRRRRDDLRQSRLGQEGSARVHPARSRGCCARRTSPPACPAAAASSGARAPASRSACST